MKHIKIIILLFVSFSVVAQKGFDQKIDSLNTVRKYAKTDSEKLAITHQIRNLLKKKGDNIGYQSKLDLSATDSLHTSSINTLWKEFRKEKDKNSRNEILTLIKQIGGLDTLLTNIDYYLLDYNDGSFDEMSNYPILFFVSSNPSISYLEYLEHTICSEPNLEKIQFLLLSTTKLNSKYSFYHLMVEEMLKKECLSLEKINIIKSHLNHIK